MQPLNLLRKAIVGCEKSIELLNKGTLQYSQKCRDILALAQESIKFILPDNGKIFDDKYRGLPEDFRLPYPSVVLEYICRAEGGVAADHFGHDATFAAPERVIVAQQDGHSVLVMSVIGMRAHGDVIWYVQPFVSEIIPVARMSVGMRAQLKTPEPWMPSISQVGVVIHDLGGMAQRQFGANWEEHGYYDMTDESSAVLELIEALSCSNVGHEALPARKVNKSAAKRGALPFDEYRVLTVRSAGAGGTASVSTIDRRQSREHLRRGHIRNLQDGRRIWVNATVVNAGVGGRITKDYRMVS
jgi:hypothetical protein